MTDSRYLENLSDGIIVLDKFGIIKEANPSAVRLLGLKGDYIGKKYADIMRDFASERNDDFHQVIVDFILETEKTCRKKVSYYTPDGAERLFQVTSSLLTEEDSAAGLVITMTDITNTVSLMHQKEKAAFVFSFLIGIQSVFILLYSVWNALGKPFPPSVMSTVFVWSTFITTVCSLLYLKLKPEECGLRYKGIRNVVITDIIITAVGIVVLIAAKLIIVKTSPGYVFYCKDNAFFDFGKYGIWDYLIYLVSVFAQEFCSRGVVHEQLRVSVMGKHREAIALILSSLYFAALHVHLGPFYMFGAGILLGILGLIYNKQKTILGLCIPHFVLGQLIGILGFVEY